jgi:hypothetical protein
MVCEYDITLADCGLIFALAALAASCKDVDSELRGAAVSTVLAGAARGDPLIAGRLKRAFCYYLKARP